MADVLADQVVAGHRHEMAAPNEAETMQEIGHAQRDRGFSRAGISGEGHMKRRRLARQRKLLPRPLDDEERGDLADPRLDRLQADELPLKRAQNLLDARALEFGAQPDRRGR